MGHLAESKRKKKLAPSHHAPTAWSKNASASSIGFKLMSSMGWAPGKGLGTELHGEQDNIKYSLKDDFLGIGAKKEYGGGVWRGMSDVDDLCKKLDVGSGNVTPKEEAKVDEVKEIQVRGGWKMKFQVGDTYTSSFATPNDSGADTPNESTDAEVSKSGDVATMSDVGERKVKKRKRDEKDKEEKKAKKEKRDKTAPKEVTEVGRVKEKKKKDKKDKKKASKIDTESPGIPAQESTKSKEVKPKMGKKQKKEKKRKAKKDAASIEMENRQAVVIAESIASTSNSEPAIESLASEPGQSIPIPRHMHRARFMAMKRASVTDQNALREILGMAA
jgi:Pin2-interacting protein X1